MVLKSLEREHKVGERGNRGDATEGDSPRGLRGERGDLGDLGGSVLRAPYPSSMFGSRALESCAGNHRIVLITMDSLVGPRGSQKSVKQLPTVGSLLMGT